jgi:hypothetical protein
MKHATLLAVTLNTLAKYGCAASLVYDSDRSRKQQECRKIPDRQERERCLRSSALSPETYRLALMPASSG